MTCPICKENIEIFNSRQTDRRKGLPGEWEYRTCWNCGFVFVFPLPRLDELEGYYLNYSKSDVVDSIRRRGARFPILRKLFHYISGDVDPRDFIKATKGLRVLDYGCGYAGYLSDFYERGVRISGAEIAGDLVEIYQANGLDVRRIDDMDRLPFENCEFDIVYLMQVFEHIRDPIGFMRELNRILKPKGDLYLAVPNFKSIWRKVFGKNWVSGWYAPIHLYQFEREKLARVACQHGFKPTSCWSRTPESWFRLNLKAYLYPDENKLDGCRTWIDMSLVRCLIMLILFIIDRFVNERDCLVMKFEKQGG